MASTTSTTGNGAPGQAVKTDFDALKNDMKALRADLAALLKDSGQVASDEARKAGERVSEFAKDRGKQALEYRDALGDKVREHPFAAVGIALAAGFVIASLTNRR
ncbi:MAG TPA: hypothetical protein VG942_07495 [Hyphomonadaceae bacterium]|nr:hypothetical protein [Hyphomonadaceae bacterium]